MITKQRCNYKTNSKVTTLIRTSGGTLRRSREGSDFDVFHTHAVFRLVVPDPILVRTELIDISFTKIRLALLDPLKNTRSGLASGWASA